MGLHPLCMGLHPLCMGLHPLCMGLRPQCMCMQPDFVLQPPNYGLNTVRLVQVRTHFFSIQAHGAVYSLVFEAQSLTNSGKSLGIVWNICPREVPRVIDFPSGPPLGKFFQTTASYFPLFVPDFRITLVKSGFNTV